MATFVPLGYITTSPDLIYLAKKSRNIGMWFLYRKQLQAINHYHFYTLLYIAYCCYYLEESCLNCVEVCDIYRIN